MCQSLKLYWRLVSISIRSQMQHRASFFLLLAAYCLSTSVDIFGIWVLFDRFKLIQGWTLPELALIYGVIHMSFAMAEGGARGFDTFSLIVKTGEFDRVLLRPCGTMLQVSSRDFQLMRLGRLIQGFIVLVWGVSQLGFSFVSLTGLVILLAIFGTTCLFYGLFVIQASISFWTVESLELMNIATYGGCDSGQYPMSIYNWGFRLFFTVVIPLACVAYYPIAILLHHENFPFWLSIISPFCGVLFLYISFKFWNLGVRHYHSTGN